LQQPERTLQFRPLFFIRVGNDLNPLLLEKPRIQSDAMGELTKGMKSPMRMGALIQTLERGLRVENRAATIRAIA